MKKIFWIVIIAFVAIFIYCGSIQLVNYAKTLNSALADFSNESSSSGTYGFKQTPENTELVQIYLLINDELIQKSEPTPKNKKEIKMCYKLVDYFPSFKHYYSAKLKLEKSIFEEISKLNSETINLSSEELSQYFNKNSSYLSKNFGISDFNNFNGFLNTFSISKNAEIISAEVIEPLIYSIEEDCTFFFIKGKTDNNESIYFSLTAFHSMNTETQKSPVIVFNSYGGAS